MIDRKRGLIELSASMDLPAKTFAWFSMNPLPLEGVEDSLRSDLPLRITPGMPEDFLSQLRVETEKQFRTAYLFHIRSGSKDLGFSCCTSISTRVCCRRPTSSTKVSDLIWALPSTVFVWLKENSSTPLFRSAI